MEFIVVRWSPSDPSRTLAGKLTFREGDILQGRWEVIRSFQLPWARGAVVRDAHWNGTTQALVEAPVGREDEFEALAKSWRTLEPHRHVMPAWFSLEIGERPCLFLENPPGPRLDAVLAKQGRAVSEEEGVALGAQLAAALSHLHTNDRIHGHLEPAACILVQRDCLRLTRLHLAGGTTAPQYRAPELWVADPTPSNAADVYALGIVLHELFCLRRPFDASAQLREHWVRIVSECSGMSRVMGFLKGRRYRPEFPPELAAALTAASLKPEVEQALLEHFHTSLLLPPAELDPDLPAVHRELVTACLDKDPTARPTAAEVTRALEEHLGRQVTGMHPSDRERAICNRAVGLWEMDAPDRAVRVLDGWLTAHPGAVTAWVNRALIELQQKPEAICDLEERFDAAIRRFNPLVDQDPDVATFLERVRMSQVRDNGAVTSVSTHPDIQTAAVSWSGSPRVCLWELGDAGTTRKVHVDTADPVVYSSLLPGDRILVATRSRLSAHGVQTSRVVWFRALAQPIDSLALSHSGKLAATATGTEIELFTPGTGELVRRIALPAPPFRLALDDLAGVLAIAVPGGVAVLRIEDGVILRRVKIDGSPNALRFVPDGTRLAIADEGAVRLLDVNTGAVDYLVVGASSPISALAFSTDGTRMATGERSGRLVARQLSDGTVLRELTDPLGAVTALAFTADGEHLIAGNVEGVARRWSISEERWPWLIRTASGTRAGSTATIDRSIRDKSLIIEDAGLASGIIFTPTGTRVDWNTSYPAAISAVAFSRDGRHIAVAERHSAHVSHLQGRRVHLDSQEFSHANEIFSVAFDSPGARLVAGTGRWRASRDEAPSRPDLIAQLSGMEGAVGLSHPLHTTDTVIGRSPECDFVLQVPSVSRQHCVIQYDDGLYVIRDLGSANGISVNGTQVAEAVLRDQDVLQIGEFSLRYERSEVKRDVAATMPVPLQREAGQLNETKVLWRDQLGLDLSDDAEGTPKSRSNVAVIWDVESGLVNKTLHGHDAPVTAVTFTRDGSRVVTVSEDGTMGVWDPETGQRLSRIPEAPGPPLTSVSVSPDDQWAVTGRTDGRAVVWDLQTGKRLRELGGHRLAVLSVAFSGDGRLIATGSRDGTARLWNVRTGANPVLCDSHTGPVTAVAFSPDDRVLLTASLDGTAQLWNRWDGDALHSFGLREAVTAIAFSDDGRLVVTGGEDGTVQARLMKCIWIHLEELVTITEALVLHPEKGSAIWPVSGEPDLDFWLDVWRDLRRCGESEEAEEDLRSRFLQVRTRLLYQVVEWLRKNGHAPSLGLGLGLGQRSASSMDSSKFDSPLRAVLQADPELAALVRMHMGG